MGEYDRWPERGPQRGELVIACGHTDRSPITASYNEKNPSHWFEATAPIAAGSEGCARWLACCAKCLRAAAGDPRRVIWREHWRVGAASASHLAEMYDLAPPNGSPDPEAVRAYLEGLTDAELVDVVEELKIG